MAQDKIIAIIPARMSATRFPGKPLKKILGISMIEHVRRRAVLTGLFEKVIVATCDMEIVNEVESFGGVAIMTKSSHERCTDRIEEAAQHFDAGIIVNIQGDEPLVLADTLQKLIAPMIKEPYLQTTNIVNPVKNYEELTSQNVVKAVLSTTNKILYMSRSAIPGKDFDPNTLYYKQTGLMAFRKNFLHQYSRLAPTPLEIKESCDMLRVLEHDLQVQAVICDQPTIGVDIPEQISLVESYILGNELQKSVFEKIKIFNS